MIFKGISNEGANDETTSCPYPRKVTKTRFEENMNI